MFSHKINNSNNFIIKDDYYIVPFGHRCSSAIACYYANIRKISLPFDWCNPALPKKIQKVLENNFDEFIPDVLNGVFDNKYNFNVSHFNSNIEKGIFDYIRRIDRFNSIINDSKKIYFIYINEDYLYNSKYREDKFNEETFNEMLELEKYMKDSYKNIDYNILYFNFNYHKIPTNSNIINIVLYTKKLYDNELDASSREDLRYYCGKILSELFNTNLNLKTYSYKFDL
jgi:hypothetical protein